MSDPITFPITVYWIRNGEINKHIFRETDCGSFTLNGTELRHEVSGIFGDYGNEPMYYSTDLNSVKTNLIERIRKEFVFTMMELGSKIKSVENYGT